MANRHRKRCLTSLIIRKIQIKTIVRYHLMSVRMAITNKARNNKYWRGYGDKETLIHCWWECKCKCKLVQKLWKTVWRFPPKLRLELSHDPAILLLGTYLKTMKTLIWKDMCTPKFIATVFTIAKIWKQPKCASVDEWIKKMWYVINQCYLNLKKKKKKSQCLKSKLKRFRERKRSMWSQKQKSEGHKED